MWLNPRFKVLAAIGAVVVIAILAFVLSGFKSGKTKTKADVGTGGELFTTTVAPASGATLKADKTEPFRVDIAFDPAKTIQSSGQPTTTTAQPSSIELSLSPATIVTTDIRNGSIPEGQFTVLTAKVPNAGRPPFYITLSIEYQTPAGLTPFGPFFGNFNLSTGQCSLDSNSRGQSQKLSGDIDGNARTCIFSKGVPVDNTANIKAHLDSNTSVRASKVLTVSAGPQTPQPSVYLVIRKIHSEVDGRYAGFDTNLDLSQGPYRDLTLLWATSDWPTEPSCTASGKWSGAKATSGEQTIGGQGGEPQLGNYRLSCEAGEVTKETRVTVTRAEPAGGGATTPPTVSAQPTAGGVNPNIRATVDLSFKISYLKHSDRGLLYNNSNQQQRQELTVSPPEYQRLDFAQGYSNQFSLYFFARYFNSPSNDLKPLVELTNGYDAKVTLSVNATVQDQTTSPSSTIRTIAFSRELGSYKFERTITPGAPVIKVNGSPHSPNFSQQNALVSNVPRQNLQIEVLIPNKDIIIKPEEISLKLIRINPLNANEEQLNYPVDADVELLFNGGPVASGIDRANPVDQIRLTPKRPLKVDAKYKLVLAAGQTNDPNAVKYRYEFKPDGADFFILQTQPYEDTTRVPENRVAPANLTLSVNTAGQPAGKLQLKATSSDLIKEAFFYSLGPPGSNATYLGRGSDPALSSQVGLTEIFFTTDRPSIQKVFRVSATSLNDRLSNTAEVTYNPSAPTTTQTTSPPANPTIDLKIKKADGTRVTNLDLAQSTGAVDLVWTASNWPVAAVCTADGPGSPVDRPNWTGSKGFSGEARITAQIGNYTLTCEGGGATRQQASVSVSRVLRAGGGLGPGATATQTTSPTTTPTATTAPPQPAEVSLKVKIAGTTGPGSNQLEVSPGINLDLLWVGRGGAGTSFERCEITGNYLVGGSPASERVTLTSNQLPSGTHQISNIQKSTRFFLNCFGPSAPNISAGSASVEIYVYGQVCRRSKFRRTTCSRKLI